MPDPGLLQIAGARTDTKFTSIHVIKFLGGLQTQRSPFVSIDTRYGTTFFGGKPDALLAGSNCEISNKLTLARRPGCVPYGVASVPPPDAFYTWQRPQPATDPGNTGSLITLVDTGQVGLALGYAMVLNNYSPQYTGTYFQKTANLSVNPARQGFVVNVVATLYFGDGIDLYKIVGPNLLLWSNTFTDGAWVKANAALVTGQNDPLNGTTATQVTWSTTGPTAYIQQVVIPFVATPVIGNTFTFSVWMRSTSGSPKITLELLDQVPSVIASHQFTLSATWAKYQVTGTCTQGSSTGGPNYVSPLITSPSATTAIDVYGAQLEIGGPATPTEITLGLPQGVYKWGISAPVAAPAISVTHVSVGLSPVTGYQYYFSYESSLTGQPSSASPISLKTGPFTHGQVQLTGTGSSDPQVDTIVIYRNVDGGAFFYQLATFTNPGPLTWTFVDTLPDSALNTLIFAPIGGINNPPPAGLIGMEYHAGRVFGYVGSLLYYSSSNDNAAQLNILFNGVGPECWSPLNVIPFDAPDTRLHSTPSGLLVFTVADIWLVQGQDLTSFYPQKILKGHGLRSWNALDTDGGVILAVMADRQFVEISPGTGSVELGFPIGDQIEANIDPTQAYVARHLAGSRDNAVYVADGSTGWYRLNPNQVGASMSGEVTPVWSPFATVNGERGCLAIASIETSPGVKQLLIGQRIFGPVLVRQLGTTTDFGQPYGWTAVIGSIYLTPAGHLAEVESITVESLNTPIGDLTVAVLLDEISGTFEQLPLLVDDPPQLPPSTTVTSNRYYLMQGATPPLCKHMQIQLSGGTNGVYQITDEILTVTIRGALVPEQT